MFYIPAVSKTLVTNAKTTNPTQNLKRILWRNVTIPHDRTWNISTENLSRLSKLKFILLSWLTYLLVVSPFDSEHPVEEWLSATFLSRSAIFTFICCWWLACLWLVEILLRTCAQRSTLKKVCVEACFYFVWSYMKGIQGRKQKNMAPISLKDPNIQGLTEEFVKALTGFKVNSAHIM